MSLVDTDTGEVVARSLDECERVIERGLGTFVEVGEALMAIRDQRLYRSTHGDFDTYCRERWGMSKRHANRSIEAAGIAGSVGPIGPTPQTESQARALAPLRDDPEAMAEVMDEVTAEAAERAARVTAEKIAEKVTERLSEPPAPRPPAPAPAPVQPKWSDEELALLNRHQAGETIVVSLRSHQHLIRWAEANGVFERIDRRTRWGNPFELPTDGDRDAVIAKYRDHYLPHKPGLIADLPDLRGRVLGCWCHPEACHGDVLAERADR